MLTARMITKLLATYAAAPDVGSASQTAKRRAAHRPDRRHRVPGQAQKYYQDKATIAASGSAAARPRRRDHRHLRRVLNLTKVKILRIRAATPTPTTSSSAAPRPTPSSARSPTRPTRSRFNLAASCCFVAPKAGYTVIFGDRRPAEDRELRRRHRRRLYDRDRRLLMPGGRRIRGDRAFKRLIKQLPDAARQEILGVMQSQGRAELSKEQSLVAVRRLGNRSGGELAPPGGLRSGLSMRVLPASLKLKVGILGKPLNRKLFYGWIVEKGRKPGVVIATRSGALNAQVRAAGGRSNKYKGLALRLGAPGTYQLRIGALPPRHFVYTTSREQLYQPYRVVWSRALSRAATGASDA
jgi:hypothetical protein